MTKQIACTLCGAGGHSAAQCNWNKASDLVAAIRAAILPVWKPTTLAATGTKAKIIERIDAFLSSQQGNCCDCIGCEAEQAEGAQGERELFVEWLVKSFPHAYSASLANHKWKHRHVSTLAWQARAALAQPSPKCATCHDQGEVFISNGKTVSEGLLRRLAEYGDDFGEAWEELRALLDEEPSANRANPA